MKYGKLKLDSSFVGCEMTSLTPRQAQTIRPLRYNWYVKENARSKRKKVGGERRRLQRGLTRR
jgi:hypothetical protein